MLKKGVFLFFLTREERGYLSCSISYLDSIDSLKLGYTYLVLLEPAHKPNRNMSDSIDVISFSFGKLYFLKSKRWFQGHNANKLLWSEAFWKHCAQTLCLGAKFKI